MESLVWLQLDVIRAVKLCFGKIHDHTDRIFNAYMLNRPVFTTLDDFGPCFYRSGSFF